MTIFLLRLLLLLSLAIAALTPCFAQQQQPEKPKVPDTEARLTANVTAVLTNKMRATVSQELRINQNISNFNSHLTEVGTEFRFVEWFNLGATYRFTNRLDPEANDKHRIYGITEFAYRFKPLKLELSARLRLEREWTETVQGTEDDIRPRLEIAYKRKKLPIVPSVNAELFYTKTPEQTQFAFSRYRLRASIEYRINKQHEITAYYFYQSEEKKKRIDITHTPGLSYTYKLDVRNYKKK